MEVGICLEIHGPFQVARGRFVGADARGNVVKRLAQRLDGDGAKVYVHVNVSPFWVGAWAQAMSS